MNLIWNKINSLDLSRDKKNKLFIVFMMMVSILIGAAVWFLTGRVFLKESEWLLCFIGYPAVFFGFFGGIIYLYSHEF